MPVVPLKKPVAFEGVTYHEVDFDPTVGGLEAFEQALAAGQPEITAMIALIADGSDLPEGAVRRIRQSDLERVTEGVKPEAPLDSSPPSGAGGEAAAPKLHTS